MRYRCFLYVLLMGLVACASSTETRSVRWSSKVVTAEEIAATAAIDAYEALQLLRPHLLQRQMTRQSTISIKKGPVTAIVYLDEVRYGDLESLRTLSTENISEIRYLSSSEATIRFGSDHAGGAFMVKSK